MVTLSKEHTTYNFEGELENYKFNGNCGYIPSRLVDVNAVIQRKNIETEEYEELGSFNYNVNIYEDENMTDREFINFSVNEGILLELQPVVMSLLDELRNAR